MTFNTRELKQLLHPTSLKETLEVLLHRGDITYFRIGSATTTIQAAKEIEILLLLQEESKPRPNPRPYVANKTLTKKRL